MAVQDRDDYGLAFLHDKIDAVREPAEDRTANLPSNDLPRTRVPCDSPNADVNGIHELKTQTRPLLLVPQLSGCDVFFSERGEPYRDACHLLRVRRLRTWSQGAPASG